MQRAKHFELPLMRAQWLHNPQTANPAQASTLAWINLATFDMPDDADAPRQSLSGFPRPLQNGMQAQSQLAAHGIGCGRAKAHLPGARPIWHGHVDPMTSSVCTVKPASGAGPKLVVIAQSVASRP